MLKLSLALVLAVLAVALAEPSVQQYRGLIAGAGAGGHPYLFLTVPRRRAGSLVQGFEVLEEQVNDNLNADDDDESEEAENDSDDEEPFVGPVQRGASRTAISDEDAENDDDEFEDNEEMDDEIDSNDLSNMVQVIGSKKTSSAPNYLQKIFRNAKLTHMMVSKEHAGAVMVPDGIIEIEGHRIFDEKTGKTALLVPREALDAIPDGSVVALMESSDSDLTDEDEERANRVIVRRRRRGSRRNVRRSGSNHVQRRRIKNENNNRNKRRRNVNRRNVHVIRNDSHNRRRSGSRRRGSSHPVLIQG